MYGVHSLKKKSSSIPEHVLLKLMKSSVKQNLEMGILFQNATLIISVITNYVSFRSDTNTVTVTVILIQ